MCGSQSAHLFNYQLKTDITLPAWLLLMEPFLKASGRFLEHNAICLAIQGSATLDFINVNMMLGQELCSRHSSLPQFGAEQYLPERGLACCFIACNRIAGITKHSDLLNVLCMGIMFGHTHFTATGRAPLNQLKGNFNSSVWGIN